MIEDRVFAVVGAGPVGTGLARVLKARGLNVAGIASRRPESAQRAAMVAGVPHLDLHQVQDVADWVFLATSDGQIVTAASNLGPHYHGVTCHLSGALSAAVLKRTPAVSLHPCASLPDPNTAFERLQTCWYAVEGDPATVLLARQLVSTLGAHSFELTGDKALYHAGACVASNYMVTLAAAAQSMWEAAGVPAEGRVALYDLMQGTLDNLRFTRPEVALTGPIRRGDTDTIHRHLYALREHQTTWLQLYRSMGRETLHLAPNDDLDRLLKEDNE